MSNLKNMEYLRPRQSVVPNLDNHISSDIYVYLTRQLEQAVQDHESTYNIDFNKPPYSSLTIQQREVLSKALDIQGYQFIATSLSDELKRLGVALAPDIYD